MRDTVALDGTWQVIFDYDNKGRALHWHEADPFYRHEERESIAVPACLEEFKQDYEGVAWYGHRFTRPSEWVGRTIRLRFEAVNYRAEVWLNGQAAGAHEGGYTGFELPVDDLLVEGENFLAVRVITPLITRDVVIDGLGRDDMPHWRGAIAGGIWQSVSLIATGPVSIDETFVTTDIASGTVRIDQALQNQALSNQRARLEWSIAPWKSAEPVATGSADLALNPGPNSHQTELAVPNHKLWQLDDPQLYVLTTTVTLDEESTDRVETRFGFREFTARGKYFYLNGEKIILKTTFNEAFYPHSLAYPRDLDLLKREFTLVKEGNINMVRPWRKPQPTVVYDMADEMGVLMVGALPVECMDNWPQITPYTQQRIAREVEEMVRRDRNHPSIVIWEMFNEIIRDGLKRLKHSISLQARQLDPSRMIIDEAGGFADGCSVYLPGSYEPIAINDVHKYPGTPMEQEAYDNLLALGKSAEELKALGLSAAPFTRSKVEPGLLTNISELGYGSIPDLEANWAQYRREGNPLTPDYRMHQRLHDSYQAVFVATGADRVFADFHAFVEACQDIHYIGNKLMAEACRLNADIAGIGMHALNDGDWVLGAGLIDNFRQPKKPYYAIKEVFADRYIALHTSAAAVYAGQTVEILLTAVNDGAALEGTLSMRAIGPQGEELLAVDERLHLSEGIADLYACALDTSNMEGPCDIEFTFTTDEETLHNQSRVHILDPAKSALPQSPLATIDCNGALAQYLPQTTDFSEQTPKDRLVLVNLNGWDGAADARFGQLAQCVAQGGTALYLNLPPFDVLGRKAKGMYRWVDADTILPFALTLYTGRGLWTPCSHLVKDHPFYDGLPVNCLMSQEYRNVSSRWSIVEPASDWIGGNITYDWYAGDKHKQNYIGVTEAFHGADLTRLAHGRGSYVLCTHRLVENLGRDPVAERLFSNLLKELT